MKTKAIRRLLVIDDDEGAFNKISSALKYYFSRAITSLYASTVSDGYSKYFSEAPDIVFLDIHFTNDANLAEGIELLKRIKQIPTPRFVPFVILSDRKSINKELSDLNEQFMPDDFIAKPIPDAEIYAKIMQWERTLFAERKLATQTMQLTRKAEDLAGKHVAAMKYLDEQHSVASLGLMTRGLLALFAETIVSVRGYASIMESVLSRKPINLTKIDKISTAILNNTDSARKVIDTLQTHFDLPFNQEIEEDITPILEGILLLARQELLARQIESICTFSPIEKCSVIPGYLMQSIISVLLFYRDSAIPGSVLEVSCRQTGPAVAIEFSSTVLRELREKIAAMHIANKQGSTGNTDDLSAECFSLQTASDTTRRMRGDIGINVIGEVVRIVLTLKVHAHERGLFEE